MRETFMLSVRGLSAALAIGATAIGAAAQTTTVQDIARLKNDSPYRLTGYGLITGLPGTGDSGKELAMVRPLAAALERLGNPVADLDDLSKTKSVALVLVTCEIPVGGARVNDQLPVTVATLGSASSIDGGELLITPLLGIGQGAPVYAMASGSVAVQDNRTPTVGNIQTGAHLVLDLKMPTPDTRFEIVLEPYFRGYGAASQVATAINDTYFNSPAAQGMQIARALDDRSIAVEIPSGELPQKAAFIADVLGTQVSGALLKLPARVICNTRTGAITFTGDVRIGPVVLTMDGVSVTTTEPPLVPTQADPLVRQTRWVDLSTDANATGDATFQELKSALDKLNIPARDQIKLIQELHQTGMLYAKLIVQ